MQCRQTAKDLQSNQSTSSCLVCVCLSLQEGSVLLFWRATRTSASLACLESSGRVTLRLTMEVSSTQIMTEKKRAVCVFRLISPMHKTIIYICAA